MVQAANSREASVSRVRANFPLGSSEFGSPLLRSFDKGSGRSGLQSGLLEAKPWLEAGVFTPALAARQVFSGCVEEECRERRPDLGGIFPSGTGALNRKGIFPGIAGSGAGLVEVFGSQIGKELLAQSARKSQIGGRILGLDGPGEPKQADACQKQGCCNRHNGFGPNDATNRRLADYPCQRPLNRHNWIAYEQAPLAQLAEQVTLNH